MAAQDKDSPQARPLSIDAVECKPFLMQRLSFDRSSVVVAIDIAPPHDEASQEWFAHIGQERRTLLSVWRHPPAPWRLGPRHNPFGTSLLSEADDRGDERELWLLRRACSELHRRS
jgi:hypothetical protein